LGFALRAARDGPARAEAIGIDVARIRRTGFVVAASCAALAGALFAFSKGSIAPDLMAVGRSIDGLVMVMLGGVQSVGASALGAAGFTVLQDEAARATDYWRALVGGVILLLVLAFPSGVAGIATGIRTRRWR
jgi:branched-chain amino acid transport system permease protein